MSPLNSSRKFIKTKFESQKENSNEIVSLTSTVYMTQ